MKRINEWLARERRRQARRPRLEHALLTDRAFGYVFYRMQFMGLRVVLRSAVHVVELILLSMALPPRWIALLIGYRASTALLSSLYWGALEQLRQSVRAHIRLRHAGSARLEIHNWLRVSVGVGAVGVLAVVVWIHSTRGEFEPLSWFDVYGVACFLRLGFDLWARTLHSGIFAVKRVYRPLWTLLLTDLVELVLLMALFPRFDGLAFIAMVVGGGVVRIGLANHYASRAYGGSQMAPPTLREAATARNTITRDTVGSAIKFGLSNATSQLDGLIIMLLLFVGDARDGGGHAFAGIYYALRPLMAVAHSWARIFYFDFKRMEYGSQLFQRRFRSLLTRTALALAGVVALLVLGLTALVSRDGLSLSLLSLVPFFFARSLMSVRQLDAFVSAQHGPLLRMSVGMLTGLGAVAWLVGDAWFVMLAASVFLLVAYRMLPAQSTSRAFGNVVGLPRFLARLQAEAQPTRIRVLTIDRKLTTASRTMRCLAPRIASGSLACFGRRHVLVFEPVEQANLATMADVARATEGAVSGHAEAVGANGKAALLAAIDNAVLPKELIPMLTVEEDTDLVAAYQRAYPQGTVLSATQGRVTQGKALSGRELGGVMVAIAQQARGYEERSSHRLDVLVYAPGGEPETIFVTPRTSRPSAEFRHRVQAATLRASLSPKT